MVVKKDIFKLGPDFKTATDDQPRPQGCHQQCG